MIGYVYTITCPIHNKVIYVGATLKPKRRMSQHLRGSNNSPVGEYEKGLASMGMKVRFDVIRKCRDLNMNVIEKKMIRKYRKINPELLNSGGGGWRISLEEFEELKKRLSA